PAVERRQAGHLYDLPSSKVGHAHKSSLASRDNIRESFERGFERYLWIGHMHEIYIHVVDSESPKTSVDSSRDCPRRQSCLVAKTGFGVPDLRRNAVAIAVQVSQDFAEEPLSLSVLIAVRG